MPRNLLDSVLLSHRAVERWHHTANAAAIPPGVQPSDIPDEDAEILPSGELRIFVALSDGRRIAECDVPASDWTWLKTGVN